MPEPLTLRPLNNHVLVEIEREYANLARAEDNEDFKQGTVISVSTTNNHITAMTIGRLAASLDELHQLNVELDYLVGKKVVWSVGAEAGATIAVGEKTYALVPFWRLIAYYEAPAAEEEPKDEHDGEQAA